MSECRFSGYPGSYCLDCGREDPREAALARGEVDFDCRLPVCACLTPDEWLACQQFGPRYHVPLPSLECPEPGSGRFDPARRR
jgi:hypothetical protein